MEKPGRVIMLPSEKATNGPELVLATNWPNESYLMYTNVPWITNSEHRQHLYVLSNDTIEGWKDKDWFIWKNELHQFHSDAGYGIKTYTDFNDKDGSSVIVNVSNISGKIIGTTNPDFTLPILAPSFIQKFVTIYNKSIGVIDVMVEYTYDIHKYSVTHYDRENYRPNVTKNNELILSFIDEKKEYTLSEIRMAFENGRSYEAGELELDTAGKPTAFGVWFDDIFNKKR